MRPYDVLRLTALKSIRRQSDLISREAASLPLDRRALLNAAVLEIRLEVQRIASTIPNGEYLLDGDES